MMMRAKIVGVRSDKIDAGDPSGTIKYIEGMWHVDLVVIGVDATKEEITDAYRDGVEFDVIPVKEEQHG